MTAGEHKQAAAAGGVFAPLGGGRSNSDVTVAQTEGLRWWPGLIAPVRPSLEQGLRLRCGELISGPYPLQLCYHAALRAATGPVPV